MSLNKERKKFFIIGFTGPIGVGCSTAAKFLGTKLELIKFVEELLLERERKEINEKINGLYKKYFNHEISEEEFFELKSLLKRRLFLSELHFQFKDCCSERFNLKYLSFSQTILIEFVENFIINKTNKTDIYEKFLNILKKDHKNVIEKIYKSKEKLSKFNKIPDLWKKLKEKKYKWEDNDKELFKEYLNYIQNLYQKLKPSTTNKEIFTKEFFDTRNFFQKLGLIFRLYGSYILEDLDPVFTLAFRLNLLIKYFRNVAENKIDRFVIESFRNPFEVDFFRRRYYEFYLFSIFAKFDTRRKRYPLIEEKELKNLDYIDQKKIVDDEFKTFIENIKKVLNKEDSEIKIALPDTKSCVDMSDIAINNNDNIKIFYEKILKYFLLILNPGAFIPDKDEVYMNAAYLFSLMSTCISRKVGAIIVNKKGYVIGVGCNDVGPNQIGCIYRFVKDFKENEDFIKNYGEDFSNFILEKIGYYSEEQVELIDRPFCFSDIFSEFKYSENKNKSKDIKQKIKDFRFIRSLHAEENAILQTAETGGFSLEGSTIYITTFPCELCAKKIARVGITRIVYVEPYPKSLAEELFFNDNREKIIIEQFEGVKPHSFFKLYKPLYDKKDFFEFIKNPRVKNLIV